MEMKLRPMTEPERMYSYTQSTQIMGQTGCIGHLRMDFGSSGCEFYTTWDDHREYLKTDEFRTEFDNVVNALRFDREYGDIFSSRKKMASYCNKHPEAKIGDDGMNYYGFRSDTEDYTYMIRVTPNKGEYNAYVYCYKKDWLDNHLQNAERGIHFITPDYKEKFRIPDGGRILITRPDGTFHSENCRYIDPYHLEVGRNLFHICEFSERMEGNGCTVEPIDSKAPLKEPTERNAGEAR